ncbi:hypothetical protein D3C87_124830 [compost metagenome]
MKKLFKWIASKLSPAKASVQSSPSKQNIPKPDAGGLVEGTHAWYREMYKQCKPRPGYEAAIEKDARTVLKNKARYEIVSKELGVPWYVIGGYHFKEGSCDFNKILHNGQKILGTGKKTTIKPLNRGPFKTWEEAAIDALILKKYHQNKDWELGNLLYLAERYNGTGYLTGAGKADTSPYLWARTNINDGAGKYVVDGKYDPNYTTLKTTGYAAILKWLEDSGHITIARKS